MIYFDARTGFPIESYKKQRKEGCKMWAIYNADNEVVEMFQNKQDAYERLEQLEDETHMEDEFFVSALY